MITDWTRIYKKYRGMWIALDNDERTVLGAGATLKEALAQAAKKSKITPIVTRMPESLEAYVGLN